MHDGNAGITNKIMLIEGQQVSDAVNDHRGDQFGIVNFDADDGMNDHELASFDMDLFGIR